MSQSKDMTRNTRKNREISEIFTRFVILMITVKKYPRGYFLPEKYPLGYFLHQGPYKKVSIFYFHFFQCALCESHGPITCKKPLRKIPCRFFTKAYQTQHIFEIFEILKQEKTHVKPIFEICIQHMRVSKWWCISL